MIKLGVLWKNMSREGNKPYLSGRVQEDNIDAAVQRLRAGGRFLILSNKKRPDKQDPDCVLFVVPEPERRDGRNPSAPPSQRRPTPTAAQAGPRTNSGARASR